MKAERIVVVDPSPKDELEYERLKNSLAKYDIDLVFLTHHHPDHHEFSTVLAKSLNLPMGMSQDTRTRIETKYG